MVKIPFITPENAQLQSHEKSGKQESVVGRLLEGIRMMGKQERGFAPLIHVSLEELVPQDHFYRHLECTLDLSFPLSAQGWALANGGHVTFLSQLSSTKGFFNRLEQWATQPTYQANSSRPSPAEPYTARQHNASK